MLDSTRLAALYCGHPKGHPLGEMEILRRISSAPAKSPMARLYELPPFLNGTIDRDVYVRWLGRKANSHVRRDRNRGNSMATGAAYRLAIHAAVVRSQGLDEYTGRELRWNLISRYDNDRSATNRREYRREFYDLPTVDHVGDGMGEPEFKICSWQVNDAKHDQSYDEFVAMCRAVLDHASRDAARVP